MTENTKTTVSAMIVFIVIAFTAPWVLGLFLSNARAAFKFFGIEGFQ